MAPTKHKSLNAPPIPPGSDGGPFANFGSGVRAPATAGMFDEIDQAFERLASGAPPCGISEAAALADLPTQNEHAALLRQIVIDQAQFLRACMQELASRRCSKRWVARTRPVLGHLLKAMEALEASALGQHLMALDALLGSADNARGPLIEGGTREALLAAHARVDSELARTFDDSFEPVLQARR
jgi:hypothetical protein